MSEMFIFAFRRFVQNVLSVPAFSVLVFLRLGFGRRAIGLFRVVFCAVLLSWVSGLENSDLRDESLSTYRAHQAQQMKQETGLLDKVGSIFSQSDEPPPEGFHVMGLYYKAFLLAAALQLAFVYWGSVFNYRPFLPFMARLGDHLRTHPMHSKTPGLPILCLLFGTRRYWLVVQWIEPLMLLTAWLVLKAAGRPWTGAFFGIAGLWLHLLATASYRAQEAQILDLQDARIEAEAFTAMADAMDTGNAPAKTSTFFPVVKPQDTLNGMRLLRGLARKNRRLIEEAAEESEATRLSTERAAVPSHIADLRAAAERNRLEQEASNG